MLFARDEEDKINSSNLNQALQLEFLQTSSRALWNYVIKYYVVSIIDLVCNVVPAEEVTTDTAVDTAPNYFRRRSHICRRDE